VPGPPVMTVTVSARAAASAARCSGASRRPDLSWYHAVDRGAARRCLEELPETRRDGGLRRLQPHGVHGRLAVGPGPDHDALPLAEAVERGVELVSIGVEQLDRRRERLVPGEEHVALVGGLLEDEQQPRLQSLGGVVRHTQLAADPVRGPEPDAEHLLGEAVGVGTDHVQPGGAVPAVHLHRDPRGHAVAGQEHHDLLDAAVLHPRLGDALEGLLADPVDLQQSLRIALHHLEGLEPELLHDARRHLGADAADPTGGQEPADAVEGRGCDVHEGGDLELLPESGVLDPPPGEPQLVALLHAEQGTDRREQDPVLRPAAHRAPAALVVGEQAPDGRGLDAREFAIRGFGRAVRWEQRVHRRIVEEGYVG
jgi:hypothetical protein